jgi:uncharacterized protein YggE
MLQLKFRPATIAALALAVALLAAAFLAPAHTASAQGTIPSPQPGQGVITVVGEGKVQVEPDTARINIGVEVLRPTVREATDANEELVAAVLEALRQAGIADEDMQTSGFSVYAERFGPNGPLPEEEVNYRVSNTVQVTVRALDTVGDVLDAAIEAGANNIYGIEFLLEERGAAESEARALAVADAQAKAAELAELNGVSVGNVVAISEIIGATPFFNNAMMAQGMGGGGVSIQPGQLDLTLQLQISYALVQGE